MKIQINNAKTICGKRVTLFIDNGKISTTKIWNDVDNTVLLNIEADNMFIFSGAKDYSFLSDSEFEQEKNLIAQSGISRIYNIHTDFTDNNQIDESWLSNKQYINTGNAIVLHQNLSFKHINSLISVLEYAKMHNKNVHINAQIFNQHNMMGDDSHISARLGISQGIACYETSSLAFILELIKQVKCNTHIYNISCAESLSILKHAKQFAKLNNFNIQTYINIHNLLLSHNDIGYFNTYAKFYPPLRSLDNQKYLIQGLMEGDIDYIYSGHTMVNLEDKQHPFASAKSGASSTEIFIALLFKLANLHNIDIKTILKKADITTDINLIIENNNQNDDKGNKIGITLFDDSYEYVLTKNSLTSQSKASPFLNYAIQGKVCYSFN